MAIRVSGRQSGGSYPCDTTILTISIPGHPGTNPGEISIPGTPGETGSQTEDIAAETMATTLIGRTITARIAMKPADFGMTTGTGTMILTVTIGSGRHRTGRSAPPEDIERKRKIPPAEIRSETQKAPAGLRRMIGPAVEARKQTGTVKVDAAARTDAAARVDGVPTKGVPTKAVAPPRDSGPVAGIPPAAGRRTPISGVPKRGNARPTCSPLFW